MPAPSEREATSCPRRVRRAPSRFSHLGWGWGEVLGEGTVTTPCEEGEDAPIPKPGL